MGTPRARRLGPEAFARTCADPSTSCAGASRGLGAGRPRCVAPTGAKGRLCGADATEEQTVQGIVMPLCAAHARELDAEDAS